MFEEIRKAAISAALDIFESMFFVFLEPIDGNLPSKEALSEPAEESDLIPPCAHPWIIKSQIHFSGNHSGLLRLFIPYGLGETLTMNFLGFEEEVTESQIEDTVGELANMVCGNLFSFLDKTSVYKLSTPLTQKISLQERMERGEPSDLTLDFQTEEQQITIQLQFEKLP